MRYAAAACSGKPFPAFFIRITYFPVKLRGFPAVAGHAPVHDGSSGAPYHFPQKSALIPRKWILLPLGVLLIAAGLLVFWSPIPLGLPLIILGLPMLLRYSPRARRRVMRLMRRYPPLERLRPLLWTGRSNPGKGDRLQRGGSGPRRPPHKR